MVRGVRCVSNAEVLLTYIGELWGTVSAAPRPGSGPFLGPGPCLCPSSLPPPCPSGPAAWWARAWGRAIGRGKASGSSWTRSRSGHRCRRCRRGPRGSPRARSPPTRGCSASPGVVCNLSHPGMSVHGVSGVSCRDSRPDLESPRPRARRAAPRGSGAAPRPPRGAGSPGRGRGPDCG
jgi:hypothetical protein